MANQQQSVEQPKREPVNVLRIGALSASVWANTGQHGDWWSVTFQRGFMAAGNKWTYSNQFNYEDLLPLAQLATGAFRYVESLRANARKAQREVRNAVKKQQDAAKAAGGAPQSKAAGTPPTEQSVNSGDDGYDPMNDVPY